ncbi:MAG: hypothetical protein J6J93_02800, partial [Muribaculaceae bacterium]|nr:hypothetical protein [Muribaculaceae bacterium]
YTAITYLVFRRRYGLRLRKGIWLFIWSIVALGVAAFIVDYFFGPWATAVLLVPAALIAVRVLR